MGFCAYSERYMRRTDAVDIEHFDPRLKTTENDDYWIGQSLLEIGANMSSGYGRCSKHSEARKMCSSIFCSAILTT